MKEIQGISGNWTVRAEFINLQKSMKFHLLPTVITTVKFWRREGKTIIKLSMWEHLWHYTNWRTDSPSYIICNVNSIFGKCIQNSNCPMEFFIQLQRLWKMARKRTNFFFIFFFLHLGLNTLINNHKEINAQPNENLGRNRKLC